LRQSGQGLWGWETDNEGNNGIWEADSGGRLTLKAPDNWIWEADSGGRLTMKEPHNGIWEADNEGT